ncbi:small subunit ribosomal protein S16 [Parelusimicrobium proximum]|uniref:30S ribosomal protein S16 n=1 Tax=Parelusimicrobium proximum TaxID=3228953 RepID=UPI003D16E523
MAVVLRLQRVGKKHQPQYRIVAIERKSAVGSESKEIIGQYNPCNPKEAEQVKINEERYNYWVKVGAKPSQTLASLVKKAVKK